MPDKIAHNHVFHSWPSRRIVECTAQLIPIFSGICDSASHVRLDAPSVFRGYLRSLANTPIELIVRVKRAQRSQRQQGWYFGCIIPMLAEHCGYTTDEMHELMAMKFLRMEDCPITGSPRRQRTPNTNTAEFAEYCDQIRIFAATDLGLVIPDPAQVDVRAA